MSQIFIFLFGVGGIWLANDPRYNVRRYACIAGLVAQPFWVYTTFVHQQWGALAATFFYTLSWARGFYTQWIKT
jgi:hypothetical protein